MIEVRVSRPDDAEAIREIHVAAFPTPAEADLVEKLGNAGDTSISLIAADEERIVGHVLFSRMDVEADGPPIAAVALAPVAVAADYRRMGVGTALIDAGLRAAESDGAEIVFVLGDANFYGRFGFASETAAPFESPYSGPHFQALILDRRLKLPANGRAAHAPAFAELGA